MKLGIRFHIKHPYLTNAGPIYEWPSEGIADFSYGIATMLAPCNK